EGQWSATKKLPPDFSKVPQDKQWSALKKFIPPPANAKGATPDVFYSDKPAEVILFDGQPVYTQIPDTQLEYATNTNSVVFVYKPTHQFYYLPAGRWFSANDLQGPWAYATADLPPDFAKIPLSSPASGILATVPGTEAAKDAVLLAQVPTTMTVNAKAAASKVKVDYAGDPKFEPIKRTSMEYAANTADKVIKVGDVYYLCLQGVWFMSPSATGPWTTCLSVPQEIYTIPSSSPVYNVTYVTQTGNPDGTVTSNYSAGYLGTFILGAATGAILADGSGYWWPPYCGGGFYYPYPATYCGAYWGMVIILMRRLTMITTPEPTAGKGRLTVLTDRQPPELVTIPTPGRTREAARSQHLMGAEAQRRPITRTQEHTRRRAKVQARMRSGAAPTFREGTKALQWAIIRRLMEPSLAPLPRRAEKWPLPARSGETAQWVKLPAAMCTRDTMETFTRTPGTVGRST